MNPHDMPALRTDADAPIPAPVNWPPRRVMQVTEQDLDARIAEQRCSGEPCQPCQAGRAPCPLAGACHTPIVEPPKRTRAHGLAMAMTYFRMWGLRYRIRSTERYLAECERAGISDGANLRLFRAELALHRAQLAELEAL